MNAVLQPRMTRQAYLDWENAQQEKHELVQGEIVALTGGRRTHGRVLLNLARHIGEHLDGTPSQVFADSLKLQVADDTILYPDVFVTCDAADLATELIFRAPQLVIEVLSPSTQAYDCSRKFALYRRLPSLQEYVLVDPDEKRVESFRRSPQNDWVLNDMSEGLTLDLASIGCQLALNDVFAGVEPPAAPPVPPVPPAPPAPPAAPTGSP